MPMKKNIFILSLLLLTQTLPAYGQQTADLVGAWHTGTPGMMKRPDQTTPADKSDREKLFTYVFLADGNYAFTGYVDSMLANCKTILFNNIKGKYTVEGSTIKLEPASDFWNNSNTCAPLADKKENKTPVKRSLEFQRKEDAEGHQLLCLTDGGTETCHEKVKVK
jgi:hypothetical protein